MDDIALAIFARDSLAIVETLLSDEMVIVYVRIVYSGTHYSLSL